MYMMIFLREKPDSLKSTMKKEQKRPSFVLVGTVDAGKSTLFHALDAAKGIVRKTQTIEFGDNFGVDTPGEFFSSRWYHSVLVDISGEIDTLIFVHPADVAEVRMPPGLLTVYPDKDFVTVITKIDLPDAQPDIVEEMLRVNGITDPIFRVNARDKQSITPLRQYLKLP